MRSWLLCTALWKLFQKPWNFIISFPNFGKVSLGSLGEHMTNNEFRDAQNEIMLMNGLVYLNEKISDLSKSQFINDDTTDLRRDGLVNTKEKIVVDKFNYINGHTGNKEFLNRLLIDLILTNLSSFYAFPIRISPFGLSTFWALYLLGFGFYVNLLVFQFVVISNW